MPTNYEAIGRCQVSRQDVERLYQQRNAAMTELRSELRSTLGSIKGTIYTFDPEAAHRQLADIERLNRQLMEAVAEFNEWAPAADERQMTVTEPHRQ